MTFLRSMGCLPLAFRIPERVSLKTSTTSKPALSAYEYLCDLPEDIRDKEIVVYCRGPYCVFSDEAVKLLEDRGYHSSRLAEGFPEWRAAGLPVVS
jgi:rhodanese-related sulfurtransferase